MKVGIVGPNDVVDKVHRIIKKEDRAAEVIDLKYSDYTQAIDVVAKNQSNVDGIIFAGKTPFKLCEAEIPQEVPWEFLGRKGSTLLRALLEASYMKKIDIMKLSFDTYTRDILIETYEEIGVNPEKLNIFIAEQRLLDREYHTYLMKFHCENYYKNGVGCCVTGFTEIQKKLTELGIPNIKTQPTASIIALTYNKLELKYLAQTSKDNQIVVIGLYIDLPNYYSVAHNDEYLFVINRNQILEKLYLFASKIEAAVVEKGTREYMLFTTKKILKTETDDLNNMYLFDLLHDTAAKNISIGIGYGETVLEAKNNATDGMVLAQNAGGNVAYAVYGSHKIRGPIKFNGEKEETIIDKNLFEINKCTGISTNTLYNIFKVVVRLRGRELTSRELALNCDMSKRNMDRIIQKLESSGFCEITGEKIMSNCGRPSRIIRFKCF